MQVEHILETCLYVDSLDAAEQFYRDVLGLTVVGRQPGRHVFFRCGNQMLLLFNSLESQKTDGDFPPHGTTGQGHIAFAVSEISLTEWLAQLTRHRVGIEKIVDWPAGGRSLYFRDPAGNSLELATPRIWGVSEDTLVTPQSRVDHG